VLIPDVRKQLVKWALWAVNDQNLHDDWHYQESRPFHLVNFPPFIFDCSGAVTWIYWKAGAQDPNRLNFSGYGNTDSLYARGRHITKSQAKAGDVIILGLDPTIHAVLIVQAGPDPLCFSHGEPGNPVLVRLSVLESIGTPTLLRFSTLNRRLVKFRFSRRAKV